jgi:hypothetical protein
VGRLHDDVLPAARARQVARLIEAANDVARTEGNVRVFVVDEVEQLLVLDILHALDRTIDSLQIGTDLAVAVAKRSIQDRFPDVSCGLAVPYVLDRLLLQVADRLGKPILTTEEYVAAVPAAAQDLKTGEGLRTEQALVWVRVPMLGARQPVRRDR